MEEFNIVPVELQVTGAALPSLLLFLSIFPANCNNPIIRGSGLINISRILFTVARSRMGELIIGWSFAYMSSLIPVDRLFETDMVVAFQHPKPSHQTHILIVPKRQVRSLLALTEAEMPIVHDVIATTQHLVKELALEEGGFSLLVNGGAYQDVMQVHWHLISDDKKIGHSGKLCV